MGLNLKSRTKKPGSVGRRYPGQQPNFGKQFATTNHSRPSSPDKRYPVLLPDPAQFFAREILGFAEGKNGWAHGCCPFHDDHHPSFAMNLESGGYKCLSSSCGVSGGNIVSFVCALHGLSRPEAYRFLEGWL